MAARKRDSDSAHSLLSLCTRRKVRASAEDFSNARVGMQSLE